MKRYDQCDDTCTTDCGHCKGAGKPKTAAERLDSIDARIVAATPGPWYSFADVIAVNVGPGDCGGCSGVPSPRHEPACGWEQIGQADAPDAEFIANARQDVPALAAALRAVLALHQPAARRAPIISSETFHICATCSHLAVSKPEAVLYPCPTVRAITAALDGTVYMAYISLSSRWTHGKARWDRNHLPIPANHKYVIQ